MFKTRNVVLALAATLACTAFQVHADTVFKASLDGAQCLPDPINTPATGTAEFRVSADGKTIAYTLTVQKLLNPSQADVHLAGPAQNGQVIFKLWPKGGGAAKRGDFSGVLAEGTIDAGDFVGPMTGSTMREFIEELKAGNVYINVHTYDGQDPPYSGPGDYRLGEIRGQFK